MPLPQRASTWSATSGRRRQGRPTPSSWPRSPSVASTTVSPGSRATVVEAHLREVHAQDAAEHDRRMRARARAHEPGLDVADPRPLELARVDVEPRQRHDRAAGAAQRFVARGQQVVRGVVGALANHLGRRLGRVGGEVAVPEPVDHGQQPAAAAGREHRHVARAALAVVRLPRHAALEDRRPALAHAARAFSRSHITSVTVVPFPGAVSMWNSWTSRRAPGRPSPSPPPLV